MPAERGIDLVHGQCLELRVQLVVPGQRSPELLARRDEIEQLRVLRAPDRPLVPQRLLGGGDLVPP